MERLQRNLPGFFVLWSAFFFFSCAGNRPYCETATHLYEGQEFSGGSGTASDPYVICTVSNLLNMPAHVDSSYVLYADLDLAGVNWTPVGDATTPFTGSFDGQNHTIKNFSLSGTSNLGFIGTMNASTAALKNITFDTATLSATGGTAGIVAGTALAGQLSNISVTNANVTAGDNNVGGIVGTASNASLDDLAFQGSVTTTNTASSVGGIAGRIDHPISLTNLTVSGTITGGTKTGGVAGNALSIVMTHAVFSGNVTSFSSEAGGLVGAGTGRIDGGSRTEGSVRAQGVVAGGVAASFTGILSQVSSSADVTSPNIAGGLIGNYYGGTSISETFATGDVVTTGSGVGNAGGLVANSLGTILVSNSFTTGDVTGYYQVGGLLGSSVNNSSTITHCYTAGSIIRVPSSNNATGFGALVGQGTFASNDGLRCTDCGSNLTLNTIGSAVSYANLSQLSSFSGWDFISIWKITTAAPPTLLWFSP